MAGALMQALAVIDEHVVAERGPAERLSPPRQRQRRDGSEDDNIMAEAGIDKSLFAQTAFLKNELKTIITQTAEDQDKKFEERFGKLERKIHKIASLTDTGMKEVKGDAKAARQAATEVSAAVGLLKNEVQEIRKDAVTMGDVKEIVKAAVAAEGKGKGSGCWREGIGIQGSPGHGNGKGGGKAAGKAEKKEEERKRTVSFANFPDNTQEDDIIMMIKGKVKAMEEDIEEVYAYAKVGTGGAAKFRTEDAMWKYMVDNKGCHVHEYGGNKVFANTKGTRMGSEEDKARDRAVGKVVRVFIEQKAGNAASTRKRLDAKYHLGTVFWKGEDEKWVQVAEWNADEGKMKLMADAVCLQTQYDKLMG